MAMAGEARGVPYGALAVVTVEMAVGKDSSAYGGYDEWVWPASM